MMLQNLILNQIIIFSEALELANEKQSASVCQFFKIMNVHNLHAQ